MLPKYLSNGLCSLVEDEDRLTKSVIILFNEKSEIQKVTFANTIIRSNKRLTYKQALAFLENDDLEKIKTTKLPPEHQTGSIGKPLHSLQNDELSNLKKYIKDLWLIASKLRDRRFDKGALDLDMNETKIYVDQNGYADKIEKQVNDKSHQLIEEFMLIANEQVAKLLKRERLACIFRVHDKPEEDKLIELKQIMQLHNISCNNLSKPSEMSRLLQKIKNHPQSYALKLNILKSLKQAQYRNISDGHYGLAKHDYTHFTSPIRRYSDLITHRILDAYLFKAKSKSSPPKIDFHYDQEKLESICNHLNIKERNSIDAERESTKVKLLEYFELASKKSKLEVFDAIITDIKDHGLFIELNESQAFGFIHISKIGNDHYYLSSNKRSIIGKRNKDVYNLGDQIKVSVLEVDKFKRQVDFKIAENNKISNPNKFYHNKKPSIYSSAKHLNELRKYRRKSRKKN